MKTRIDAARLLVLAGGLDGRRPASRSTPGEGSMSKLFAGETAVWVTEQAIQILGGYGYVREYPVERWHRDSKIYTIFEGTSRDPAPGHRPGHLGRPHQLTRRRVPGVAPRRPPVPTPRAATRRAAVGPPPGPHP